MNTYEVVSDSFKRCGMSNDFYDAFYDIFLSKSGEIKALFAKTKFEKQKKLLKMTVTTMVRHPLAHRTTQAVLKDVGRTHGKNGYNIRAGLYDAWLDSLCDTVKEHDPRYTPQIEQAWRRYMEEAIRIILANYK